MKMIVALAISLLFVSSCSLMTVDFFSLDETKDTKSNITTSPSWEREERRDYGPVTAADFQAYVDFHTRVACGEATDKLLIEYGIDVDRLVEIGRKYDNETLKHSVFEGIMSNCPNMIEYVEPSIGNAE